MLNYLDSDRLGQNLFPPQLHCRDPLIKMAGTDTTSMADDEEALRYLPPGWTEEKYANATDEDFDSLPDDVSYSS